MRSARYNDGASWQAGYSGAPELSGGPPSTQTLRDEVLAHAERHLADFVGPIASVLVEQAAAVAFNREEFYAMLAEELDSALEREAFLKRLR